MSARYAVYFVPADDTGLARFGNEVLGRDAQARPVSPTRPDHPSRETLSSSVSRYGFHATLKAPFERRAECDEQSLADAVQTLAATLSPVPLTGLQLCRMDRHLVLCQQPTSPDVQALACRCVIDIEPFRAPDAADVQRRMKPELSPQQRQNLQQFGYAMIFDDFRFHMTLGGPLPVDDRSLEQPGTALCSYWQWLQEGMGEYVSKTAMLDRLALCFQPSRDADFVRLHDWELGQS